jgi:NAD(P)-dependent dehydrogenase (short-subunit alcohol dehydrogenase family)
MSLDGKVVAITGAAGSLGAALAQQFALEGALIVLGDIDVTGLERVVDEIKSRGGQAQAIAVDVTLEKAVDQFVAGAREVGGRLDIMINNAGILNSNGRIHNLDDAEWRRVIDVNLMGTVHGIRSAVQVMRRQGTGGAIVNTASIAGISAWPYTAPYGATKAAVIQLTKIAAIEYARDNIRVNCVCPGTFLSNIHKDIDADALATIGQRHPLGLGKVEDLVPAFLYLVADESRWTTGTAVIVDGGYSAQ